MPDAPAASTAIGPKRQQQEQVCESYNDQQQQQQEGFKQQTQGGLGRGGEGRSQRAEAGYQLVVIDVNYFPSYNSPGAAVHVWQALLDRLIPFYQ